MKAIPIIFISFALLLITAGCAAPPEALRGLLPGPADRYVAEGDRLAANGRVAEAILTYRQAVMQDARHTAALRKLALAYAGQRRGRLARQYLEKAIALRPGDAALAADLAALPPSDSTNAPLKLAWRSSPAAGSPIGIWLGEDALLVSYEDGRLQSLDPVTGGLRWEQRLPARASSPPTAGASGAGQGLAWVGGADGALHALDLRDGTPRWRHQTAAPIYAAPLVTPDALYVPSGDGTLAALTPADGKELWRLTAVGPLTGRPALAGQRLYFGSADGRIHCVDAATGAELWGSGIVAQGMVESQPVIVDGRVFVGAGDSRVYALAADTGGEYWRHSTPDAIYAQPLVVGETVYAASAGNTLSALDVETGDLRWEVTAGSALRHAPALAVYGGTPALYYVAAADPHLYAVDAATGAALWQFDTGDWLASGPVIAGDKLYLLGQDGAVLAYKLAP